MEYWLLPLFGLWKVLLRTFWYGNRLIKNDLLFKWSSLNNTVLRNNFNILIFIFLNKIFFQSKFLFEFWHDVEHKKKNFNRLFCVPTFKFDVKSWFVIFHWMNLWNLFFDNFQTNKFYFLIFVFLFDFWNF